MVDVASTSETFPVPRWYTASTTPDRLRLSAIATVLVIVAAGVTAWLLTDRLVSQTTQVATSTGEVLVATQQVSASFAEADAAAASVHLAGADGNREQRRLFEQATERATALLEDVARLVGDDERSHEALQDVGARTVEYAGLVEAARLASIERLASADQTLIEASALNRNQISPEVRLISDRATTRFNDETSSAWYLLAIIALLAAIAVLVLAQLWMSRRFRRLVNLPLFIAAAVLIVLAFLSARGFSAQQRAFDDAQQEAFDEIVVSQEIQQIAYRHRADTTSALLLGRPSALEDLDGLRTELAGPSGLLEQARAQATSPREKAGVAEIVARWDRYIVESERVQDAVITGDFELGQELTQGSASAAFNGFNTSVEAALLDNREQFLGQLNTASDSLNYLRGLILAGSLLAAVLTWWGFGLRIGEYR